ncbi:hypothetical protein E2C01_095277 [Portunus trituberculatus]|uniref:Uncharacterized protein n=1 Tax=Portunus trituberculatus TaxID=210409 RepID=A0A5B7JZS5_PORTR|nr:hypothetical protein [Portunus trituberculatus]
MSTICHPRSSLGSVHVESKPPYAPERGSNTFVDNRATSDGRVLSPTLYPLI